MITDLGALVEDLRELVGELPGSGRLSSEEDVLTLGRDVLHRVIGLEVELG